VLLRIFPRIEHHLVDKLERRACLVVLHEQFCVLLKDVSPGFSSYHQSRELTRMDDFIFSDALDQTFRIASG
jgi:hypothetical protein